jgi:putative transposase
LDPRSQPICANADPSPHTTWHLDEVYLKIDGRMVYLWRAVDAAGEVLDVLVQTKRNKQAALRLMRKLLKKLAFVPDKLVTDDRDLRSCGVAASDLGITRRHERGIRINRPDEGKGRCKGLRKISLNACSSLQHLQRPTPCHLSKNAPSLRASAMQTWREVAAAA